MALDTNDKPIILTDTLQDFFTLDLAQHLWMVNDFT